MKVTNIKSLVAVLMLLLMSSSVLAQQVSESEAKTKAMEFFSNGAKKLPVKNGMKRQAPAVQEVKLAYTSVKEGKACFYVFNNGDDGGFVIVGGDEVAKEILAYVPQGHFDYEKAPANVKWWLGEYEKEISTAKKFASQKQQDSAPKRATSSVQDLYTDIPDLISTKWGQDYPYNVAIPSIVDNGTTYHSPTGCVATALAQIMNYWQYPLNGIGSKSYNINYPNLNQTITYSADFSSTTYDWNNMLDDYSIGNPTQTQIEAVSTLMYHIGVALESVYDPWATGYTPIENADEMGLTGLMRDLPKYFNLDKGLEDYCIEDFTAEQWKTLLYNELEAGRPVLYSGVGYSRGGHSFVCHGYSATLDMFSFNWGWDGREDGYFSIFGTDAINGFNKMNQRILVGLRPMGHNESASNLVFGDKFLYDNIWYKVFDEKNRLVEVTHTSIANRYEGEDKSDYNYCSGHVTIPSVVQCNGTNYTVSRIGSYAFMVNNYEITNVTSISLPNTITSLGAAAFYGCRQLDNISIPDVIKIIPRRCFEKCHSVKCFHLPNNIRSVGDFAFGSCSSLEDISIPEGCDKLGIGAFIFSSRLTSVNLPSTLRFIDTNCFEGTNLTRMSFPCDNFVSTDEYLDTLNNVTHVTFSSPFPECIKYGTLYVLPELVDTFRDSDTYWSKWGRIESINNLNPHIGKRFVADAIEYMVMNDSVVSLTGVTDRNFTTRKIILPDVVVFEGTQYLVKTIGPSAFADGFKFGRAEVLILPEGLEEIGSFAFSGSSFRSIVLPNTLRKIGQDAFFGCRELEQIEFPSSLKSVEGVGHCNSLKQVILHEGIASIGPNFLERCPKIEQVLFPHSIWYSGGGTLVNCESLNSIVSLTDSLSVSPFKINLPNKPYDEILEDIENVDGRYAEGYGSNHDTVNLFVPESLLQDDSSDYNRNYPWTEFPNKLSYIPMTSFELTDTIDVVLGEERIISRRFFPEDASYQQLKWTSSDGNIVDVSCEGTLYARSEGNAIITANAIDGSSLERKCVVRVHPLVIPTDPSSFCLYMPSYEYTPTEQNDTVQFPITCQGEELFVAFDLFRTTRETTLSFMMADQSIDIYSPSVNSFIYNNYNTIILKFENVANADTLKMIWKNIPEGGSSLIVKNIRVWNDFSKRYPYGDVNLDEVVNITDAVCIINDRLGYESANFIRTRSDVNRDEQYTITDAVAVLNIMYGEPVGANAAPRRSQAQEESLDLSQMNNNTIALDMNCANGYTAFQFDVELPEGIMLDGISLNENRCKDFAVRFNKADNNIKVVAYNLANEPLTIGSDNLLTLNISGANGSDEVRLTNIHFSTLKAVDVLFDDLSLSMTTGILSHTISSDDVEHNVTGMRVNKDYRGIVIVNGKKVIRK